MCVTVMTFVSLGPRFGVPQALQSLALTNFAVPDDHGDKEYVRAYDASGVHTTPQRMLNADWTISWLPATPATVGCIAVSNTETVTSPPTFTSRR